jgi:hypothetical protein
LCTPAGQPSGIHLRTTFTLVRLRSPPSVALLPAGRLAVVPQGEAECSAAHFIPPGREWLRVLTMRTRTAAHPSGYPRRVGTVVRHRHLKHSTSNDNCCARSNRSTAAAASGSAHCFSYAQPASPSVIQLAYGLRVTAMRDVVSWGLFISTFVFFIGISHAGTYISAVLRVTNAGWRRVPLHRAMLPDLPIVARHATQQNRPRLARIHRVLSLRYRGLDTRIPDDVVWRRGSEARVPERLMSATPYGPMFWL